MVEGCESPIRGEEYPCAKGKTQQRAEPAVRYECGDDEEEAAEAI